MNITDTTPTAVTITLSRRNLETLITMLDVHVGMPVLYRRIVTDTTDVLLTVRAEENDDHYASRTPGVGPDAVTKAHNHRLRAAR
jgi:hypothetical protein